MSNKIVKAFLIFSAMVANCWAGGCSARPDLQGCKKAKPDPVDKVLKQLREKTAELKSYQCLVEYEVNQPTFESRILRKGVLYYKKAGKDSALRINFATFKQDDEKEEKYIDQYIINGNWLTKIDYKFEGIWLTHIDHQLKNVQCHQLAEPNDPNEPADANKPTDPFDLVTQNFPIVGFTKVEDLRKEFEIKLVVHEQTESLPYIHLHLKVKPDSVYKDDYTTIDFWIDKKLGLPARIVAVKTTDDANLQGDILQIKFIKPKINKKIDKKVFGVKIPKGFGKPELFPLKKAEKNKDTRPKTND
jgi:outer membrane lipoprotein-sorting protein